MAKGHSKGRQKDSKKMTHPKEWPYKAQNVRNQIAERLIISRKDLRQLITGHLNESETLRLAAKLIDNMADMQRILEAAGAKTTPDEL